MKKVIFAVAGSGKTTYITQILNLEKRFLLITYTENNKENIYNIVFQKFGYIPSNILILTYFSFLFQFCIRPFCVPDLTRKVEGLVFLPGSAPRYSSGMGRYVTKEDKIYHSRAYDFIDKKISEKKIGERIQRFFDCVVIDEVQDFAGYDFGFIELLGKLEGIDVLLVGDFFQHTFDTSLDGNKNKKLHDNFVVYKKRFKRFFEVDEKTLSKSYRCPESVCRFVRNNFCIDMSSFNREENTDSPIFLENRDEIDAVFFSSQVVKLFYQKHQEYNCCSSANWGECKGLSYDNVCVVLNQGTLTKLVQNKICELAPRTKNKFYVACTRTRGKLYFVSETLLRSFRKE